ncbi:hypothetical protein OPQ81_010393 [Rhizoctonia solani]|nr:hypothetical protein OPQ81_010393 [Rhizoctonia solani]
MVSAPYVAVASERNLSSRTAPISTIEIIDLGFSGLAPGGNYPGPSWASNISTREPGTPSERSDIDGLFSSHLTSHPSLDPSPAGNSQSLVLSVSIPRQAPTPPYHLTDIGIFGKVSRTSQSPKKAPKKDTHQSMTPGQASLFDALFSLAQPENHKDILGGFTCLDHNPPGPILAGPSYNLEYDVKQTLESHSQRDLEDSQDAYQVGAKLCESLALDKKVKSNTLPFVLQSYALWMKQFLFEPIRIIPLAREYTFEEYSGGPQTRWRMTTISNVVRAITGSTGYTLKDLEILQSHMHQGFVTTISNFGADQTADRIKALMAMSTTYEV